MTMNGQFGSGKQVANLSVRVDERLEEVKRSLLEAQGISLSDSDYLRGLIVLHALLAGADLRGVDIPGWLSVAFPQVFGQEGVTCYGQSLVVPFTRRISQETQEEMFQGLHMIFSHGPSPVLEKVIETITRYATEHAAERRKRGK